MPFRTLSACLLLCLSLNAQASAPSASAGDMARWDRELAAKTAAKHLAQAEIIEAEARRLPQEQRHVFLMNAAALLNMRIDHWRSEHIKGGRTPSPAFVAKTLSHAILRLSTFAQSMGFEEAAICHLNEGQRLERMADGYHVEPANCRLAAYPGIQALARDLQSKGQTEALETLSIRWSYEIIGMSMDLARMAGY